MTNYNRYICSCKKCRKKRRKGLILGSKWAHFWVFGGLMKVSDYVPYHRWQKGRRRKDRSRGDEIY